VISSWSRPNPNPLRRGGPGLAGYELVTNWSRKSVTRSDASHKSQGQLREVVTR
jgi:hypothetical protein